MSAAAIRAARPEDAKRIREIYAYYVQRTAITFEYDVPTLAEMQRRMRETSRRYPYLVAEADGVILGYAYAGPFVGRAAYDWACETTIYLNPAFRKRGLGRQLYETLERRLVEMGVLNLCACIAWPVAADETLDYNSPEFHAHMGYAQVAHFHRCGYKFGRWYDMIWMEKFIGAHREHQPPVRFPDAR